ncbi:MULTISPECIES: RidA family protein [Vibrio]|uniref:Enamine deaminase RidA n=1 Tax=Vibrio genomosp. F6 str. FF-238 TaxID=1191298 RepID=A0A1E5CUS7_9VIBR|nr:MULTISPECIES: Rid family detoxifying hydrolase [Vibrio]NOH85855.1 RidA family protein [Vibrio sp. 03-59-1]OEE73656.1 enamine deaminase RidA [Vibrio genomosp. F6 str. FF-238]
MRYIQTNNALKPAGHYSQAIVCNNLAYVSGQLPISPDTGRKVTGDVEQQARRILDNLAIILEDAGSNLDKVLKLVIYISDVHMWDTVNSVCGEYFTSHKPVRTIVPTRELHFGLKIEIDCIALCE